jgi:MFS family permease
MGRFARYDFWEETSDPHCLAALHPWEWTVRRSEQHEHADRRSKCVRQEFCIPGLTLISCLLAIQGLGAGANQAITEIIVSDLVPVAERGLFFGIIGM